MRGPRWLFVFVVVVGAMACSGGATLAPTVGPPATKAPQLTFTPFTPPTLASPTEVSPTEIPPTLALTGIPLKLELTAISIEPTLAEERVRA